MVKPTQGSFKPKSGWIEDALITNFLSLLATGEIQLPKSSGIRWLPLRGVKVGYSADIELPKKWIDLLLIEDRSPDTEWIREFNIANDHGIKFSGKHDNTSEALRNIVNKKVWIVEAKASKKELWEALGQAFFYRALFAADYPSLNIVGSLVIYPARDGRDKIIEYATQVVRQSLGIIIEVKPVAISDRAPKKPESGKLDNFV